MQTHHPLNKLLQRLARCASAALALTALGLPGTQALAAQVACTPSAVTGAVVTDTATGLTCTTLTCSSTAGSCPGSLPTAAAFTSGTAITLGALPVSGTVTLNLTNMVS